MTAILDFIENFYGRSLGELVEAISRIRERRSQGIGDPPKRRGRPTRPQGTAFLSSELFHEEEERAYIERMMEAVRDETAALEILLRPHEFMELYRQQIAPIDSVLPPLAAGELRPSFGRAGQGFLNYRYNRAKPRTSTLDLYSLAKAMYGSFSPGESQELKSVLLYAHSSILLNPFAPRPELERDAMAELDHDYLSNWGHMPLLRPTMSQAGKPIEERLDDFSEILIGLSVLEPLIRDQTVTLVTPPDPHLLYFGDELALRETLGYVLWDMRVVPSPRHPDGRALAQVLILRAKEQVLALLVFGELSSTFAASELDVIALKLLLDEMIASGSIPPQMVNWSGDDKRLTRLANLRLPGVQNLAAKDMVAIRRHDLFERFRSDVRLGLRSASEENDLNSAQLGFSGEMLAALQRLDGGIKRSAVEEAVAGDAISWAIGALVGWSIDGWRGAVLGLTGKGIYEATRTRESRGVMALRNHYVALS